MAGSVVDCDTHSEVKTHMSSPSALHRDTAASFISLGGWVVLVASTVVWGRHLVDDHVAIVLRAAPLAGRYEWRITQAALVPVVFAAFVVFAGPWIMARIAWWRAVVLGSVLSGLWAVALSRVDDPRGFTSRFRAQGYLQTAEAIHDPHAFLSQFVERIGSYNVHTRGHPPGMEIFLWASARLGLSGIGWNAMLAVAGGAAAGAAALVALRELTSEHQARAAASFVVLAPAAIWWSSGDAFFAGVSGWAVALVVLATGRQGRSADVLAVFGGLLFGATAFLSYGLVLLVLIPLAVAVSRKQLRPIVLAALGALVVFVAFGAFGFSWFAGLAATRHQYWAGVAHDRPFRSFVFADLAAFALAIGPAATVAIARLRDRRVWLLVGAALVAIAVADLSAMSKGEVERIWLPFVPWVLLATCVFAVGRSVRRLRFWLGLQAASAVVVELAVRSKW